MQSEQDKVTESHLYRQGYTSEHVRIKYASRRSINQFKTFPSSHSCCDSSHISDRRSNLPLKSARWPLVAIKQHLCGRLQGRKIEGWTGEGCQQKNKIHCGWIWEEARSLSQKCPLGSFIADSIAGCYMHSGNTLINMCPQREAVCKHSWLWL